MIKVGVLSLQGAVREHVQAIEACGAEAVVIKKKEQLANVEGLVMPGGVSTAIRRLIDKYDFMDELKKLAQA
ncbi:pyridoxal 5'-phosphate synthase glutaminase subunit PdxT, partial [Robertmurraya sp. DFI.2.37]|nr:pyridoxal 5'-phosphate synthase glutaminase subunit PdxT [Robertmurraya sp. DFI.2.37]